MNDIATIVTTPGGAELASRASGRPGAPWIVLSNSLGATMRMWEPQLPLLEASFRVLRYDTRGHGASTTPPAPYAFDDLTADAVAVMDAHGVETAHFVGLSLGGMTALGLGLAHSERVDRIVCCAARADAPPAFVQSWHDRLSVIAEQGIAGIWPGTLERWLTPATRAAKPAFVAALEADFLATTEEGYHGCAAALKTLDYRKSLGALAVPALFVAGAEDMAASAAVMRDMADAAANGRFVEIPKAAHILNVDNLEAFAAAVGPFLGLSNQDERSAS